MISREILAVLSSMLLFGLKDGYSFYQEAATSTIMPNCRTGAGYTLYVPLQAATAQVITEVLKSTTS